MKKFGFYYFVIVASTMLLGLLTQTVNAGVIPGTLNKGTYTSSTTCGTSTNSYNPSGGYCSNTYCRTYAVGSSSACGSCTSYQQVPNYSYYSCVVGSYPTYGTCTAANGSTYSCITGSNPIYGTCSYISSYSNGACLSYPTCRDASFGCADYYHYPIPSGSLTFTNYLYANSNPNYGLSGDSRKLGNDTPQTCNKWANGTNHSSPYMGGTNSCQDGSSSYYIGGANGVCNKFGSTDNLITSFNQVGAVTRSAPADTDATCTVQGRYASADDSGPSISLNGVSNVFDGDQNNWCNYTKYTASNYGTTTNPELPGCTYYKNKTTHAGTIKNPDLLEGLTITVDDPSGISQVTIELGSCTAVYDYASDVGSILVSTTAPSGVKSAFKGITYNYNIASTSSDSSILAPSLLQKFGVSRLDACLIEGKNYLKIIAKDQARSDADGVSYAPNFTTKDLSTSTQFIKIDNAGPAIGLTGNAAKIAESNASANMFVGGATIDGKWKNFTITGGLKSTDPFGSGINPPSCLVYTGATYTCTTSATKGPKPSSAGVVWSAPSGVNGTTGVFTGYMCDGLGPIPSTASCDWSCATGYTFDTTSNACVASSNLFILFDAGTPNATGNLSAKLTSDSSDSRGLLKTKDAGACIAPFNTSIRRTYNFKYQPLATYNFSTIPTGPFQIVENGTTACSMPPPPPPAYTYSWFGGAWGACQGQCGTNGTRTRTIMCKRSDGSPAADSQCTGTKPTTSEACAMAACPIVADDCPAGDFSGNTFDGKCTNICIAGGIVPCTVGGTMCTKGTIEISPTPSLNCADTSTPSAWYKSAGTGRCGEQEGIDHWNAMIATVGITAAKSSFDYNIVDDCTRLSGTSDLTTCFSRILCGYGDYISNTNQCVRNDCGLGKIDGVCGSANGGTFSRNNLPPDTQQCSSGIAIHSQVANGKFDWKCDGRDGGVRASCSATITESSPPPPPAEDKRCYYADSFITEICASISDCAPTHQSWDTQKCGLWSENPQCDGYKDSPVVSCGYIPQ